MRSSFLYSLMGHLLLLVLLFVQIPAWDRVQKNQESVPLMVDLRKVQISRQTNLPPKAQKEKTPSKERPAAIKKEVVVKAQPVEKKVVKPLSTPKMENAAPIFEKKVEKKSEIKPETSSKKTIIKPAMKPKIKPKQPEVPTPVSPKPLSKPQMEDELETLFASVEKMEKKLSAQKTTPPKEILAEPEGVDFGIAGGKTKAISRQLSVSQMDFLSSTIRRYWNRDPGMIGVEEIVIDLHVFLDKNGNVMDVVIEDKVAYRQNKVFKSLADSARRAVMICDKLGVDSPFRMLARQYPQDYLMWKDLLLSFNPMEK